jgi:ribonuclease HII
MIPARIQAKIQECDYILGSDECGFGSWAGPLTVCAVVASKNWTPPDGVKDSKALPPASREKVYEALITKTIYCLVSVGVEEIDRRGVGVVLLEAHAKALRGAFEVHKDLGVVGKTLVIVDGNLSIPGTIALPKADALIPAVSAASIIGKVSRDRHMAEMDVLYPGYGFKTNCGYGTPEHQAALKRLGICPIHRKSYAPIAALLPTDEPREAWFGLGDE